MKKLFLIIGISLLIMGVTLIVIGVDQNIKLQNAINNLKPVLCYNALGCFPPNNPLGTVYVIIGGVSCLVGLSRW